MFEVGWSEILVIAIVALIVFPTEDLPKLLRTAGQIVGRLRRMAGDFQSQMNTVIREAEREIDAGDIKNELSSANPLTDLKKTLDPIRSIGDDLKRTMASATAPAPAGAEPAAAAVPPPETTPLPNETATAPVTAEPEATPAAKVDEAKDGKAS